MTTFPAAPNQQKKLLASLCYRPSQHPCNGRGRNIQFGEGEHFPPQVFQRSANVVHNRMIDNQETVVDFLASMHRYRRILAIVPLHIQLKLAADLPCVNVSACTPAPRLLSISNTDSST